MCAAQEERRWGKERRRWRRQLQASLHCDLGLSERLPNIVGRACATNAPSHDRYTRGCLRPGRGGDQQAHQQRDNDPHGARKQADAADRCGVQTCRHKTLMLRQRGGGRRWQLS